MVKPSGLRHNKDLVGVNSFPLLLLDSISLETVTVTQ